jgi:hypothetical protein
MLQPPNGRAVNVTAAARDSIRLRVCGYRQQTFVNDAGVSIFFDGAKAAAPLLTAKNRKDPKELSPGDIQAMLLSAAEFEGRVETLQSTMKTLEDDYTALLRQP